MQISTALHERFDMPQVLKRPGPTSNLVIIGDLIPAGYVTLGLYGMAQRLQDKPRRRRHDRPRSQLLGARQPDHARRQAYRATATRNASFANTTRLQFPTTRGSRSCLATVSSVGQRSSDSSAVYLSPHRPADLEQTGASFRNKRRHPAERCSPSGARRPTGSRACSTPTRSRFQPPRPALSSRSRARRPGSAAWCRCPRPRRRSTPVSRTWCRPRSAREPPRCSSAPCCRASARSA